MPLISRRIPDLAGNTADPNNSNSQSTWFSYIRSVYSRQRGGTIIPPTKTEFMREWNSINRHNIEFSFCCEGNNLGEFKENLSNNDFPSLRFSRITTSAMRRQKFKIATWARMIMAFNMYAAVRQALGLRMCNKVDFIGSAADSTYFTAGWEARFHGRCALYIRDTDLNHLIDLVEDDRAEDFWLRIFDIYDSQYFIGRFRSETQSAIIPLSRTDSVRTPTPIPFAPVPVVDAPTHAIAQEYLNRVDSDDEDIALSNQQVANMILGIGSPLPDDIKKIIRETCLALHISHPVPENNNQNNESVVVNDYFNEYLNQIDTFRRLDIHSGGWSDNNDDFNETMNLIRSVLIDD